MCNNFRRVTYLLIAISLVALVVTGCGKKNTEKDAVAVVNGESISTADFNFRLDQEKAYLQRQGASFEGEQGLKMLDAVKDSLLQQMIQETVIHQDAKAQGINITDQQVEKSLADLKAQFPKDKYEQALKQQNLTEDKLKEELKYNLTSEALFKKATGGITVSDSDIKNYYNNHKSTLELVKVRHILIAAQDGTATPEEIAKAKKKAEDLIAQLNKGADFATLAKANSDDPGSKDSGGVIPNYVQVNDSNYVPEFVTAAFALKVGEYSPQPVKSVYGYHIIKVDEKKTTLEELSSNIKDSMMAEKQNQAFTDYYQKLEKKATIKKILKTSSEPAQQSSTGQSQPTDQTTQPETQTTQPVAQPTNK
ncbi:MAG: peptidylprolyl isomerase [Bacillota bacterium]